VVIVLDLTQDASRIQLIVQLAKAKLLRLKSYS
jgi:hypothetical protein